MKRNIFALFVIILTSCISNGQINLVREGVSINNSTTGSWNGDIILRNVKTNLIYQNNSITSVNSAGYMLLAGDEAPGSTNNNLDGAKFTGNKFIWNGANSSSVITHGVFTGYNKDLVVKYNYLENVPYGIIFKSGTNEGTNMTFTSGGCAYNICKNGKFAVRLKGMNGLKIYNNTFYSGDNAGWYLVLITSNTDRTIPAPSLGTSICNNIFYSTSQIPMIAVEEASLSNFVCDYNVYWCVTGEPTFLVSGKTLTWAQWQAKGFDLHSKIVDPAFINTTNFVPTARLDYGIDLGSEWQAGLSTDANWQTGISPSTASQNGKWQVGARIYNAIKVSQVNVSSVSEKTTIDTYGGTLQLAVHILPENAVNKSVVWTIVNGEGLATITAEGLVTAMDNGTIVVRATAQDGSSTYGEVTISIINQKIMVKSISITDDLQSDTIKGLNKEIQIRAVVTPLNTTNKSVEWSIENLTGKATIDGSGLLKTNAPGKVKVWAKSLDGSQISAEKQYIIVIPTLVESDTLTDNFRVYPNPTSGFFYIEIMKKATSDFWIEIVDLMGNTLEKRQVFDTIEGWQLPQTSNGLFLVKATASGITETQKLIVTSSYK